MNMKTLHDIIYAKVEKIWEHAWRQGRIRKMAERNEGSPEKVYMSMTWNIPVAYANALQEAYPGMTLASAIKILVTSTLTPIETKEI